MAEAAASLPPIFFCSIICGATGATTATGATAPPISSFIALMTSPTVRVRDSLAVSLASTFSSDCTSLKISTRLMLSMPSSVSSSMSISSMSRS